MRARLALAGLLLASSVEAGTFTERRLELPGALIEDFGPGIRYFAVGPLTGRFDDDPRVLRVTRDTITFTAPGVVITCTLTYATRVEERGRITTATVIPGDRTRTVLTWQTRWIAPFPCLVNGTETSGAYYAARSTETP